MFCISSSVTPLCLGLGVAVLFSIICIPFTVGCCCYCWYRRYRRRRMLEHYRRLLFEPVSVPPLDDDSQRILDESYESYQGMYSRGVNPASRLTPQECMSHCKKIVYTNTIAGKSYSCINESCTICLEDYNHRETIVLCPCHHGFHEKCLLNWFRKSPFPHYKCPICKSPVIQL